MELPSIGRAEGICGNYHGTRDREAGPPVRRCLDAFRALRLTLGCVYTMSRPTTTGPRAEQREGDAKEDLADLRRRRTSGATVRCQRRDFPSVFPHHVEELIPSHHYTVIPTAGGATSVAAAHPRIAAARGWGGAAIRDLKVFNRGQYEYGYGNRRKRCAKVATLGYWTPGELLCLEYFSILESSRLAISRMSRTRLVSIVSRLERPPPKQR